MEDPYSILCCLKLLLKSSYLRNSLDERETEVRTPKNIEKVRQAELQKGTDHILQTNYIFLPPQLSPPLSCSIFFSFSDWTVNLFDVKRHCFLTKRWSFHLPYSFKLHRLKTKFQAKPAFAALNGSNKRETIIKVNHITPLLRIANGNYTNILGNTLLSFWIG